MQVEVEINELNLLQLACREVESGAQHTLEFNLRASTSGQLSGGAGLGGSEEAETKGSVPGLTSRKRESAFDLIRRYYGKGAESTEELNPKNLLRELEALLGPRESWELPILRELWEPFEKGMAKRQRSAGHEAQWLRQVGYILRPGFGDKLDQWRMDQLWRAFGQGLFFPKVPQCLSEWWIMWRRVSGGLSHQRQSELFRSARQSGVGALNHPEGLRALAALERLGLKDKTELLRELLKLFASRTALAESASWGLARLLARVPLYAEASWLLELQQVEDAVDQLLNLTNRLARPELLVAPLAVAGRLVGVRELELSQASRERILEFLRDQRASTTIAKPLRELVPLASDEQVALYGDALPIGLRLEL